MSDIRADHFEIRGSPAQRRESYRDILERLETLFGEDVEILASFWERMENDYEAWDITNPFQSIVEEFPKIFDVVKSYRSMQSRANGSWRTIRNHWGDAANAFMGKKYDMLKYMAQCAPYQIPEWCAAQISEIIKNRLQNPGRGIPTSKDPQNRDWMKLADFIKRNRSHLFSLSSPLAFSAQDVGERQGEGRTEEKRTEEKGREEEGYQEKRREERCKEMNRKEEEQIQEENFRNEENIQDEESHLEEHHNEKKQIQEEVNHKEEKQIQRDEHRNQKEPQDGERDNKGEGSKEEQQSEAEERSNGKRPQPLVNNINKPRKRAKRRIECSCDPYPIGPSQEWKTEMQKARHDTYDLKHRTLLLSGIAWGGGFAACPAHLRILETFLNLNPQLERKINLIKASLREYWKARYNIEEYIRQNPHLFVRSGGTH